MILKLNSTGREMPCTKQSWDSFTQAQKEKFTVIEGEKEVKIIKSIREKKHKNAN